MGTADATLRMILLGEDRTASKALKGVGGAADTAEKKASKLSKGFHALGTVAKVGAAAGITAVGAAVVSGLKDAADYQKLQGQTGAVLKSTGQAAGVTSKHVLGLANTIAGYSDGNDDAIQSGENLLLTFTNIQNKAGEGNKIFDQATKTMADMSIALGQDTKSSAIQLGKALNDPIKGVTALQRVGVSFTDKQKAQIKTMVESGHTMKAQKLILGELHKEFGGSAKAVGETFAGSMGRLQDAFGDMIRNALIPLIPKLTELANWMTNKGIPAVQALAGWLSEHLGPVFTKIGDIVHHVADLFHSDTGGMSTSAKQNLGAVANIFKTVVDIVRTLWKDFGKFLTDYVISTLKNVYQAISGALKIIEGVFKVFDGILHGNWKEVWQGIKLILSGALEVIKAAIKQALNIIKTLWKVGWVVLKAILGQVWDGIKAAAKAGAQGLVNLIKGIPGDLKGLAGLYVAAGKALITGFFNGLKAAAKSGAGFVADIVGALKSAINHALHLPIVLPRVNTHIPGVGTVGGETLLPALAKGGIVTRPTVALIGEAGPEAVVPLSRGAGMGGGDIHVTINGALDPIAVGKQVEKVLTTYQRVGKGGARLAFKAAT